MAIALYIAEEHSQHVGSRNNYEIELNMIHYSIYVFDFTVILLVNSVSLQWYSLCKQKRYELCCFASVFGINLMCSFRETELRLPS